MKRREQTPGRCFDHYVRPYLASESIELVASGDVELRRGSRRLKLTIDGDLADARKLFEALRDPASAAWQEALREPDPGLLTLLERLDRLGWIGESDVSAQVRADAEREILQDFIHAGVDWLRSAVDELAAGTLCPAICEDTSRAVLADLAGYRGNSNLQMPDLAGDDRLEHHALHLLLWRWQSTSPLALQLAQESFRAASNRLGSEKDAKVEFDDTNFAIGAPQGAMSQAWTALVLFVLAMAGGQKSQCAAHLPSGDLSGSGLRVLLEAEDAGERLMEALGRSPLLSLIELGAVPRRIAAGVYMHQYFITIRYVEAVLSFLRHQMRAPLKATGWRYLMEEYGHEVHELRACLHLGVTDAEMADFSPLPFFSAYPDILSLIAEEDPLAFCLSVTIAEGLPGTTKPIADALQKSGLSAESLTAHQDIDEALDHSLYTRRFLQHVPWIAGPAAERAIRRFLFLLELSQSCWSELAWYVASPTLPVVPRALGLSPREVLLSRTERYSQMNGAQS
jgi:hypothetical protein